MQKEAKADFDSFDSKIPCITSYPLEEQFQKAYTTSKFKEFQDEIKNKLYSSISSEKKECGIRVYEILQDRMGGQIVKPLLKFILKRMIVTLGATVNYLSLGESYVVTP